MLAFLIEVKLKYGQIRKTRLRSQINESEGLRHKRASIHLMSGGYNVRHSVRRTSRVLNPIFGHIKDVAICQRRGAFDSVYEEKKRSVRHLDIWKKTFIHNLSRRLKG